MVQCVREDSHPFGRVQIPNADKGGPMNQQAYSCAKCGGVEYQTGELRTTGSGLSRFFNIQNQKYGTISCKACGYTEMYRRDGGGMGNVLDFFTN